MKRLTYWNCKEKGSALPVQINEDGDTVYLEYLCAKLAEYEDTGLTPEEIITCKEYAIKCSGLLKDISSHFAYLGNAHHL